MCVCVCVRTCVGCGFTFLHCALKVREKSGGRI